MFQTIIGAKEGERHHLERRILKMETISNLCANKKTSHKYHARGARCAHGDALWGMNHKGGRKKNVVLA
jgi:hypothetical protein